VVENQAKHSYCETVKNLTLSLSEDLYHESRKLAAAKGTSLSRLVAEYLEELVSQSEREEQARERLMILFERGPKYGGKPAKREDLHDR